MNTSPTIALISAALVKAQGEMGNAKKDADNPFFKKKYADLNAVREAVLPALNAQGISIIQPVCVIDGITHIETVMLHESGEYISSLCPVITDKVNDAQRHGSGISYARRYALMSIVNIGAEDDDANAATGKTTPPALNKPLPAATAKQMEVLLGQIKGGDIEAGNRAKTKVSFNPAQTALLAEAVLSVQPVTP